MGGPFDSAWLKWAWAVLEAETLKAEIEAARQEHEREGRLLTTRTEYDPKRHCLKALITDIDPLPIHWGLRLGRIVGDYRSSLDHLAWALVIRGKTPPSQLSEWEQRSVYFPVCVTRTRFDRSLEATRNRYSKLPGVRPADIAIVRRYQPYKRGEKRNAPRHALAVLETLSNLDKHREIQPVLASPTFVSYEIVEIRDLVVTRPPRRARRIRLDVGAEVAWVGVRKIGPNPEGRMDCEVRAEPFLEHAGGVWLENWLAQAKGSVAVLLSEFAPPPPDLRSLGPEAIFLP